MTSNNNKVESDDKVNSVKQATAKTTLFVMLVTFGAKVIGYVRELVLAGVYGTSYVVDAYIMSQTIPNMILGGVISAVATTYIPLLADKVEKKSEKDGNRYTEQVLKYVSWILIGVSALGIIFSEQLTHILASGFTGEAAKLTSIFLKITFGYTVFWARSRILDAYSQYKGVFVPQIIYGYVQNAVIIIGILVSVYYGEYILGIGFLLGHVVNYLLVHFTARRHGYICERDGKEIERGVVAQIVSLAFPVFIGSEVNILNAFVDKWLATRLGEGAVASLSYAYEIKVLILAFTATIYVSVIYPQLARTGNADDKKAFCAIVEKGMRMIVIMVVPCMLGAIIFAEPIVRFIYQRGAFDATASAMTGSAFAYYSVGIIFLAFNALFTRVFYALKDVKTPVRYGMFSVVINIILNIVLVNYMQHNGLALSTSIAAAWNTLLLYKGLRKKYPWLTVVTEARKMCLIIGTAVVTVCGAYGIFILLQFTNLLLNEGIALILSVIVCIIMYFGLMLLLRIDDIEAIKASVCDRIIRRN